jgi:ADP-heptose:LPS heptosyltransferase
VDHGLVIRNKQQAKVENLLETAAAVMQCDVVLTVDTMVAHVGDALGKPVWVLLHFDSDWRWMLDRLDSPWYPTMRLFNAIDWIGMHRSKQPQKH